MRLAVGPWVDRTGAGVAAVVFSRVLSSVSTEALLFTNTSCVLLGTKYPCSSDVTWLPDKNKEESQTSTRAVHILVGSKQARAVPEASGCQWSLLPGRRIRGSWSGCARRPGRLPPRGAAGVALQCSQMRSGCAAESGLAGTPSRGMLCGTCGIKVDAPLQ